MVPLVKPAAPLVGGGGLARSRLGFRSRGGFLPNGGQKLRDKANYRAANGSAGAGVGSRSGSYMLTIEPPTWSTLLPLANPTPPQTRASPVRECLLPCPIPPSRSP